LPNRARSGLSSGLDVLEHLSRQRDGVVLTDIARAIGMSKSGVHSVMAILLDREFVAKDSHGAYRLGVKAWEIGSNTPQLEVSRIAAPHMQRLARDLDESAMLGILDGGSALAIHLVEGQQAVRVQERVGQRMLAHCTSIGLALLAAMGDNEARAALAEPLEAVTPDTLVDPAAVMLELRRIRERGYAINMGGWRIDVAGAAVIVPSPNAPVRVALSVAAPRYRATPDWFAKVGPALIAASRRIADEMPMETHSRRRRAA
jgi:IclR family transcriptional regulator, KDG regulon repressor